MVITTSKKRGAERCEKQRQETLTLSFQESTFLPLGPRVSPHLLLISVQCGETGLQFLFCWFCLGHCGLVSIITSSSTARALTPALINVTLIQRNYLFTDEPIRRCYYRQGSFLELKLGSRIIFSKVHIELWGCNSILKAIYGPRFTSCGL